MLIHRDLHVALVEGPVAHPRMESTIWRHEEMVLIASPRHNLARRRKPVAAADLADTLIVTREPGSGTRTEADRILREIGVGSTRALEIGSTEAIKQLVAAGVGVSVVPRAAVADLSVGFRYWPSRRGSSSAR